MQVKYRDCLFNKQMTIGSKITSYLRGCVIGCGLGELLNKHIVIGIG